MCRAWWFLLVLQLAASRLLAEPLSLAPVFQDAMVLQQAVDVPVWGQAKAGEPVSVTFAGQRKATVCDADGRWRISFDPLAATDVPRELTVVAGRESLTIRDVLVGEVWIAVGQSNMEFPLNKEAHANVEIPKAHVPNLRLLNWRFAGQFYSAKPFGSDVLARHTPQKFFQGNWQRCSPDAAKDFSAVAYYFGKEIYDAMNVPVGIIHLAVGGSPTEAWIRRDAIGDVEQLRPILRDDWLENDQLEQWCRQRGRENLAAGLKLNTVLRDDLGPNHPFKPGFLWDAGIKRLLPFPMRGVIWYQGESNSLSLARVRQHELLFPLLVADWRSQWGIGEFPFLFCQLSGIGVEKGYKSQYWPEFRDSQRRMLNNIPNTSMAVTSDLGHPTDVHPRNKRDVGNRLALCALANVYGKKVAFSGPLPRTLRRQDAALVVGFDYADGLTTADGKPVRGFEVAGEDGEFLAAEVSLGASTVTVSNPKLANPVSVRYAWQPYSAGNLINGAALPASTFELSLSQE